MQTIMIKTTAQNNYIQRLIKKKKKKERKKEMKPHRG